MKTFIRRPGNKTKHLNHIIPRIPKFSGTYYEPFLGTGAVYLHILPKKAVLNDLNKDISNIWKLVKNNPVYMNEQIEKFKKSFIPLNNIDKLEMCKNIVSKLDKYSGPQRTINYLLMIYCSLNGAIISSNNTMAISGLYRHIYFNESCHIFTETYKSKILELQHILKNIKIENKDYSKVLDNAKKGDFVFLDPPYIEERKYAFSYNKDDMFDIKKLKNELQKLDKKKVKWMMTQVDTKQVRELFKKYKFYVYINSLSCNNNSSGKSEVIITNY
jgi:DNA adenine methylase